MTAEQLTALARAIVATPGLFPRPVDRPAPSLSYPDPRETLAELRRRGWAR